MTFDRRHERIQPFSVAPWAEEPADPALPPILLDVRQMQQVFTNMVVNAAQAMKGEGVLSLATRLSKEGDSVEIDVSDTGLRGLAEYLRTQSRKAAEKAVLQLKPLYADRADIVENGEIIDEFVVDVARTTTFSTDRVCSTK